MPRGDGEFYPNPVRQKIDGFLLLLFYGGIAFTLIAGCTLLYARARVGMLAPHCTLASLALMKDAGACPMTATEIRATNSLGNTAAMVLVVAPFAAAISYFVRRKILAVFAEHDRPLRKRTV